MRHELKRLRFIHSLDTALGTWVAECTAGDYIGEPGSPAFVGRRFYAHQDEANAEREDMITTMITTLDAIDAVQPR